MVICITSDALRTGGRFRGEGSTIIEGRWDGRIAKIFTSPAEAVSVSMCFTQKTTLQNRPFPGGKLIGEVDIWWSARMSKWREGGPSPFKSMKSPCWTFAAGRPLKWAMKTHDGSCVESWVSQLGPLVCCYYRQVARRRGHGCKRPSRRIPRAEQNETQGHP